MLKYFKLFAPNTHCALVVALSGKSGTIQYGYKIGATRARVFFQTLACGNSKNEDKETEEECKKRGASMERNKAGTKEKEIQTTYHYLIKIQ